jgi:hypothetical protein
MKTKFKIGDLVMRKYDERIGVVYKVYVSDAPDNSYYVRWCDGLENWWEGSTLELL